jgi:hypothetical protein
VAAFPHQGSSQGLEQGGIGHNPSAGLRFALIFRPNQFSSARAPAYSGPRLIPAAPPLGIPQGFSIALPLNLPFLDAHVILGWFGAISGLLSLHILSLRRYYCQIPSASFLFLFRNLHHHPMRSASSSCPGLSAIYAVAPFHLPRLI